MHVKYSMGCAPCKFTKVGCHPKTANKLTKNTLVKTLLAMTSSPCKIEPLHSWPHIMCDTDMYTCALYSTQLVNVCSSYT